MKKILSFIFAFFTFVSTIMAQPSAELFKQVLQLSGQMETMLDQSPETLDQIVMVAKMNDPTLSDEVAKEKLKEYLKNEFFEDITSLVLPYYSSLTDADCQILIKELGKKELQESMKRITTSAAKSEKQMSTAIATSMQQIAMGNTPEPITYNDAPSGLIKKFGQYADLIGLEATVEGAINSIKKQILGLLPDNMKDQMENSLNGAFDYLKTSLRPMTFNLMSESITEQDFQRYIDIYSTPAGQHMVEGNKAMAYDMISFSMNIMQKMVARLK